jgi:hypothetical protein
MLNVNKLFQSGANSPTPEGTVHNQKKFRFITFTTYNLDEKNKK